MLEAGAGWNDPTPLWLSLYLPLGVAALLFVVAGVCWLVGWLSK